MALEDFGRRMREILETPLPMDPETRELSPRLLPLSTDARKLLSKWADKIEAGQADGAQLSHFRGYASKAAEQAARIAGVLTLWGDLNSTEVAPAVMRNAITLAEHYLGEVARLADAATVSVEIERAEKLRIWLLEVWTEPEILVRDVQKDGPIRALRNNRAARAALALLEQHGWLVPLEPGAVVRGATRAEAWLIVRANGR